MQEKVDIPYRCTLAQLRMLTSALGGQMVSGLITLDLSKFIC